jgi:hypothetical protein
MKHSEEQILAIAEKVLQDLQKQFYSKENIEGGWYTKEKELARGSRAGEKVPLWTVSINEPVTDSAIFLTISDETGEPLYIQNKHGVAEIEKDVDGNYSGKR